MSKRTQEFEHFARPWTGGWQLWRRPAGQKGQPVAGGIWEFVREAPDLAGVWEEAITVALPARLALCVASWIPEKEAALAVESARLMAEAGGFLAAGAAAEQFWAKVLEGGKAEGSLVRAVIFPGDFALPGVAGLRAVTVSPLALELPAECLCYWREGAMSVLALTSGRGGRSEVVLWEARAESLSTPEGQGWLEGFLLEAAAEGLVRAEPVAWDFSGEGGWRLPDGREPLIPEGLERVGPPPVAEVAVAEWVPPAVEAHRLAVRRREQVMRWASWGALGVLLAACGILAWLVALRWELRELRREIAVAGEAARPAMETARQWQILAPSFDPRLFPLERLLLAVDSLPQDGIRLTMFDCSENVVRIEGEARNVGLATAYFNALQSDGRAAEFSWQMPSPVLQPDNSARFAIEGTRVAPAAP